MTRLIFLMRWPLALVAAVALLAGCATLDQKQREWIFRPQRDVHATPADVGLRYDELWLTVAGAAPEGERVQFELVEGPKGLQANNVKRV